MNLSELRPRKVAELFKNQAGEFEIKQYKEVLFEAIDECGDDQIMFIPIIGPFQTGKSSFLSVLLENNNIEIGDTIQDQTMGVDILGPVDINVLKSKYGFPTDPNRCIKLFFVDTQGYGGFTAGSNKENSINITRLISSFIPLSQIVLLYTLSNVSAISVETLNSFFNLMLICFSSFKAEDLRITNIVRLVGKPDNIDYKIPDQNKYNQICNYLERNQPSKFKKIKIDHYLPYPRFDSSTEKPIDNLQNPNFIQGLKFLLGDLFNVIDDVSFRLHFDRTRVKAIYEFYSEETSNKELESFANVSRKNADLAILKKQIDDKFKEIIPGKIKALKNILDKEKKDKRYPFKAFAFDISKDMDDLKKTMEVIFNENTAYRNELHSIYEVNIKNHFYDQCKELINDFLTGMIKAQKQVEYKEIVSRLDYRYQVEIANINSFTKRKESKYNQQLGEYFNDLEQIIEDSIVEFRKKGSINDIESEVRSMAHSFSSRLKNEIVVLLERKVIENIELYQNKWYHPLNLAIAPIRGIGAVASGIGYVVGGAVEILRVVNVQEATDAFNNGREIGNLINLLINDD